MAEEQNELQDDIIVIDESEAAGVASEVTLEHQEHRSGVPNKKLLMMIAGGLILLLLILIIVLLATKLSTPQKRTDTQFTQLQSDLGKKPTPQIETSKLEKMITKANYLYAHGNQPEALKLYEKIALYSEAISQYNLGVAQLKEREYPKALERFKLAISKGEHRCVSAINAAVCALNMNDREKFQYYIDLAYAYLPYETKSPLYNYYFALIHYYRGFYLEALSALEHPSSEEYHLEQRNLKAKIDALYANYYDAIAALESPYFQKDAASLGTLYANIGDLTLAKKYLSDAIMENPGGFKEQVALAYVELKSGLLDDGGKLLQTLSDMYPTEVYKPYPITVHLQEQLFNPDYAQTLYRNRALQDRNIAYQKLFYFAPYKVFNAKQTISYIRKGNANIYIDDISSAKEYLKKSANVSGINYGIAQAIQKALSFRLKEAEELLLTLHEQHPKHSILNYDLGLVFAQSGDFVNAHDYFLKSYYLDADNYLSGIFALMCSQLIGQVNPKLRAIIKENLSQEDQSEAFELYRTLLEFSQNNFVGTLPWLEKDYKERPLYLMLNILIAQRVDRYEKAKEYSNKLVLLQPHDIVPHIIYADTHFSKLKNRAYAKKLLSYLAKQSFTYDDLYFGPFITRYLYARISLITGRLYPLEQRLKEKLETTTESPTSIMQALALISIYSQKFENAYLLYNQLIDEHKIQDPLTLFLGAVASIGANHHANGIALLELAKLKNPNFMESRYALGLLYMERHNFEGAGIQFQHIGNSGFSSQYFNFSIDTDKLLFEKRQQEQKASQ